MIWKSQSNVWHRVVSNLPEFSTTFYLVFEIKHGAAISYCVGPCHNIGFTDLLQTSYHAEPCKNRRSFVLLTDISGAKVIRDLMIRFEALSHDPVIGVISAEKASFQSN